MNCRHLLPIVLSALSISAALGGAPTEINYQGRLLDSAGQPITGNVTVFVRIYTNATAGTAVYAENIGTVPVQNGMYHFQFGADSEPMRAAINHDECWLEVAIDGAPLAPRQKLLAVPYALRSGAVDHIGTNAAFEAQSVPGAALVDGAVTAGKLDGSVDERYVNADGDTVEGTLVVRDSVGIGTNAPSSRLEVVGGTAAGEFIFKIYAGPHIVAWARKK